MKRPRDRESFTYRIYCDLICEAKSGSRKGKACAKVAAERGVSFGRVYDIWRRYVRPNILAVHGRKAELF